MVIGVLVSASSEHFNLTVSPPPSYPLLAAIPCTMRLFSVTKIKRQLQGHRFDSVEETRRIARCFKRPNSSQFAAFPNHDKVIEIAV